jgi:tetratricopeptide (TPR) repeat protein/AraC-like DNA-binding protein
MIRLFSVLIFFSIYATVSGQQNPDADKQRFDILDKKNELTKKESREMLNISDRAQNHDIDLSLQYLSRARKHYEKQKDYFYLTEYAEKISLVYMIKGEPEKGMSIVNELFEKYEDEFSDEETVKVLILKVRFLEHMDRGNECLALIDKLLPKTDNENFRAALYTFRGGIKMNKSNYEEAATNYYKALRIYEKINSTPNIITINNRLGLLNDELDDEEKALGYYKQALKLALELKSEKDLAPLYLNMANTYQQMDSIDKAFLYYDKNLELVKKTNNQPDIARNYLNRGTLYLKIENYSKAFEYFEKSLKICNEFGIGIGKMHNFLNIGKAYNETRQYGKAISALDSAVYYAKLLGARDSESFIYSRYSEAYNNMGNSAKALAFYTKFHELESEILNENNQKAIAELEIKYKSEIKDQKIEQINEKLATEKAENKTIILSALSVVLITGLIIFFLIYRNKTLRRLYERNIELMKSVQLITSEAEASEKAESKNKNEDNLKKVFDRLLVALEKDKIYTDPMLSLSDTATLINSNDKYVSSAIAEYANMNYSNFINFYRVNEAKRLIYKNEHTNLNEVMAICGFNSRTTFYNAFTKHTGMSAKQFREMGKNVYAENN